MGKLDQIRALREQSVSRSRVKPERVKSSQGTAPTADAPPALAASSLDVAGEGVAVAKAPRKKKAKVSSTYQYRDPKKRRAYMRNLMRAKRRKKK